MLLQNYGDLFEITLGYRGHQISIIEDSRKALDAIGAALGKDGKDSYEMTLALDGLFSDRDPIDTLTPIMKFIHTRHTFAYLQYLTFQGQARKENRHGRILFSRYKPVESDLSKR